MNPTERFLEALRAHGVEPRPCGKGWQATCPAHDDSTPSLSISEGDNGGAVVKCHAKCKTEAICSAVGLKLKDLMPDSDLPKKKAARKGAGTIEAFYDYCDETGEVLFQVVRFEPKDFRQRRPDGKGWVWNVKGVRSVPYRLPELVKAPTRPVAIVEGEKDVINLVKIGVLATCNAGGAGKWTAQHAEFLRGRHVAILPDNDEPGRNHARQVAQTLCGVAESVRIVELPGLPEKGDVSDWIAAGGTAADLNERINAAEHWSPTAEPWPEIQSFDELDLPKFPVDALPPVLRDWVKAESHVTQTPADLAGLMALAVCSAMIARRVIVKPTPGWCEPVNLFVAILLESGNRKSTVFNDAVNPLRELEGELVVAARPRVARAQSERRQAEKRLQKLEKIAAEKDDAAASHQAANLAAKLAEQPNVTEPRLVVDDATSEKLGMMLAEQGGRIASMSPEGGVFDLMAGMYSKSGMPQFGVYLMGHSGDDLVVDRVTRATVRVKRPALTCAYTIQPNVIEGLAGNVAFRGRGLLARFLYAVPKSWVGHREIKTLPVPDGVYEAYRQAVRALHGDDDGIVLELTPEASNVLTAWRAEIEPMLAEGNRMELIRDWGSKLAGATIRLAAVMHCVQHGLQGRIDRSTIAAAIRLARYLIPHADVVLNMAQATEDASDDDAKYVLRWIERHERRSFTKRDVHQHGKRRFSKVDDLDPALGALTERGYIRPKAAENSGPGRPPSPAYEVNPALFDRNSDPVCSQNADRPTANDNFGNSENGFGAAKNEDREVMTI